MPKRKLKLKPFGEESELLLKVIKPFLAKHGLVVKIGGPPTNNNTPPSQYDDGADGRD